MGLFKPKCIMFWKESTNEVLWGTILYREKNYDGDVVSYYVSTFRDNEDVKPENVLYIGDFKNRPVGIRYMHQKYTEQIDNLANRVHKLENELLILASALSADRDCKIRNTYQCEEGKDGKSASHHCKCSGKCSGNHK